MRNEVRLALISHLSDELLNQVLLEAQAIRDDGAQLEVLESLVPHVPSRLIEDALLIINSLSYRVRGPLLLKILHKIPDNLLGHAANVANHIDEAPLRTRLLFEIANRMRDELRSKTFEKTLASVETIQDEALRLRWFKSLYEHLSPHVQQRLLRQTPGVDKAEPSELIRFPPPETEDVRVSELMLREALSTGAGRFHIKRQLQCTENKKKFIGIAELRRNWSPLIEIVANGTRQDALRRLHHLVPILVVMGGDELAGETLSTIQDVCRWWA